MITVVYKDNKIACNLMNLHKIIYQDENYIAMWNNARQLIACNDENYEYILTKRYMRTKP